VDKVLALRKVALDSIQFGTPTTVELIPEFACANPLLLPFQVDPPTERPQYQKILPRRHHTLVFVYLTYFSPIPLGLGQVSFKCVAVNTIEERFFVLDETCSSLQFGQSSLGRKALCLTENFIGPLPNGRIEVKRIIPIEPNPIALRIGSQSDPPNPGGL
jgi:hypothetical protein